MSNVENILSIPDPERTIEGLRDTGYNFVTAVADLVDNSIAAKATKIDIRVVMAYRGDIQLSIADNGTGMTRQELIEAMRYGSPRRENPASLGKFGLGLKTASTAFARRLSLISRPSNDASALMAVWDLDHVHKQGEWLLQMFEEPDKEALQNLDEVSRGGTGTVVLWTKVDRLLKNYANPGGTNAKKALQRRCAELKEHIAMTYQRFLDKKDKRACNVEIRVNGESVQPWDPFQKSLSELVAEDTFEVVGTGAKVHLRAYILPRREECASVEIAEKVIKLSSNRQGLYVYREERLIHAADWLGMWQKEPHATLLRVEFSFDHKLDDAFHLDIKKSQIILNDELWTRLKDQFLTAPRREAITRYRKGRKRELAERSRGAHDASNASIRSKVAEVGGAEVDVSNPETGEVTIRNRYGEFKTKLRISSAAKPGEVHIQPVESIEDGLLFEPAIIERQQAARINTMHPYYHKVYVPNLNESVTVQGLDSLLWALCVTELNITSDKVKDNLETMRREVSHILRKLVENLPEPETDEEADAA